MMASATVARIGLRAMLRRQTVVVPGTGNKLITLLIRLLPRRLLRAIAAHAMNR